MLFYSAAFIFFAPVIGLVYFFLPYRLRWIWLLLASYFFYAYSNWSYVFIILCSTVVDYGVSLALEGTEKQNKRYGLLLLSLIVNLGLLFYFKYFNFFFREISSAFHLLDMQMEPFRHSYALPVGISFYTFQTLSYTIDVYRRRIPAERHFGKFALYVSFFPQLIAGPIERAGRLLPQMHFRYDFNFERVRSGVIRFMWGLFKKLVVADNLALFVNPVFAAPEEHQGLVVWLAGVLFLYQLFYDFSAYTDMAIGLGTILGIRLSENFTHRLAWFTPSFVELWRNWHITLTLWIRDYVYVPLARVIRSEKLRRLVPLLTFTLIGLWHGAEWTFVIWGALNGLYFVGEAAVKSHRQKGDQKTWASPRLRTFLSSCIVFLLSWVGIVFFRAASLPDAVLLLENAFQPVFSGLGLVSNTELLVMLSALFVAEFFRLRIGNQPVESFFSKQKPVYRFLYYIFVLESILFLSVPESQKFIYFQF